MLFFFFPEPVSLRVSFLSLSLSRASALSLSPLSSLSPLLFDIIDVVFWNWDAVCFLENGVEEVLAKAGK